jgi:hypothetical protein
VRDKRGKRGKLTLVIIPRLCWSGKTPRQGLKAPPALKRIMKARLFPGALKRSFPRMNAGASTTNCGVLTQTLWPAARPEAAAPRTDSRCGD